MEKLPKPKPIRGKLYRKYGKRESLHRAKAIKVFCIECMGGDKKLVKGCTDTTCPLFRFRTGKTEE